MPPIGTDLLWQTALARWAEIAGKSPDLEPGLPPASLLRTIVDAAEVLSRSMHSSRRRGPGQMDPAACRLRNETIPIPAGLTAALPVLCETLVQGGAGDAALHIRDALLDGTIDARSMLAVSLARNEKAIRTSGLHLGLSPDLVWLIGELASSPLAHHLQARLLGRAEILRALRDWDRGYCPCCGSWPVFIEVLDGTRVLRCSYCAAAWELSSCRCLYCGNSGDDFVAAEVGQRSRRVELCGGCGGYTKTIEVSSLTRFPLLAIEDLASVDLDEAAMHRGYRRPTLYNLDNLEPLSSGCA